jgi:hypothetical protein
MKLVVLGAPQLSKDGDDIVVVRHDTKTKITTVACDIDIITLGIALQVLEEQYNNYLQSLDKDMAEQIREVTRRAVQNGQNQRESSKPISITGGRKNDGSDGKINTAWGSDNQSSFF